MKLIDQIAGTFGDKIDYVRKGPMGVPNVINIDLSVALTDQEFNVSGNMFYVWESPDGVSYVDIKVNETSQPAISYPLHTGLRTPFHRLLITTPAAQTGNIVLVYGTEAPELLEVLDNRSVAVVELTAMLGELQGDIVAENFTGVAVTAAPGATTIMAARADRKGGSIQALSSNTGSVFLGFLNTVTVGGAPGVWWKELAPGADVTMDDYRGPIFGIATAAQVVGTGEW